MTDTVVSDAELLQRDDGVGSIATDTDRWHSAGTLGATARAARQAVVDEGLTFAGHDGANDQVDVTAGRAVVLVSGVQFQSATGGSSPPAFDSTLAGEIPIPIELPTDVTNLSLTAGTLNDVWIALDTDGTGPSGTAGDVYLRHGTGLSAPSHPSVYLGRVSPDDATADALANRSVSTSGGWENVRQQGQRELIPKPAYEKPATNPILSASNVGWTTQLSFPSFFEAGAFLNNATARYYNYYSSHADDGLGLLHTDNLRSGWTDEGKVADGGTITGGSTILGESDAIWLPDESNGPLHVYASGTNNDKIHRWYATDDAGVSWAYDQEIDSHGNHSGYPRIYRVGDDYFMTRFVNDGGASGHTYRSLSYSPTGTGDWTTKCLDAGLKEEPTGGLESNTYFSHYAYLALPDGGYYVTYSDKRGVADNRIRHGYTRDGLTIQDWGVAVAPDQAWEDGVCKYGQPFLTQDGTLGILYSGGDNGGGGNSTDLGIALADSGVWA